MKKRRIIIDTDPGYDDALAIMLIEKSRLFDLLAITTVAGNSTIQSTTHNARYVLDLLGSAAPLYSGAAAPLKRELIPANVDGLSRLARETLTKQERLTGDAADRMIEIIRNHPREVSILALGPLTNLAEAFRKDESIIPLTQEVVMMGGAIAVPGNQNRVAEFNIFVDPEAADLVFRAAVKKTLIPLDACHDVFLTLEELQQLKGSALYEPIQAMMACYLEGARAFEKTPRAYMYDPLAAYFLMNPDAYLTEPMDIQVETESELTRGMTAADRRGGGGEQPNVVVAKSVDRRVFVRDFLEIIKR